MEQRVVIVTGGNRGIGKAIVEEFLAGGDIVYAISRSANEEFGEYSIAGDICDEKRMKEVFQEIYKKHKRIDVLINNAGIMKDARIGMIANEMLVEQFQINSIAMIQMTQLAVRFMRRSKKGSIVNVASIIGTNGNGGQSVYSATKGAVISFTKSAAKELAPEGIRVNAVAPGIINTDLIQEVPEHLMAKRIENIGLERIGETKEVAKAVHFLASDQASYISGQILGVDGCAII